MINSRYTCRKALQAAYLSLCFSLIPAIAQAMDTPSNVRGTVIADGTIEWKWDPVPGAVRYDVIVDHNFAASPSDASYTSRNLAEGEHGVSIKAVDSSWNYSAASTRVKVTLTNGGQGAGQGSGSSAASGFSAPDNLRGVQVGVGAVQWSWSQVQGASQYEVNVDGQVVSNTSDLNFSSTSLWSGDHSLTVRAIDSNNGYSSRSRTAKILVPSSYDSNNPAQSYIVGQEEPETNPGDGSGDLSFSDDTPIPAPPPPLTGDDDGMIDPQTWTKQGLPSDWELTFSDEFDGNSLNPVRWNGQLRWDGEWNGERYEYRIINGEAQMYVNPLSPDDDHLRELAPVHNPFQFNGSRLAIRAVRNPLRQGSFGIDHGALEEVARQQEFLSGSISTYDKFYQKYGRFEARIKIPSHEGTFPAFWLYHQNRRWEGTQRTEIDIMENLGHAPHFIYNTVHYHTDVSADYSGNSNFVRPSPSGQVFTGTDYSEDYHVYAVEWSPSYVAWYIDDEKVSELRNDNVNFEELYVILNLAMGGNWANFPTNSGGMGRPADQRYPTDNDVNILNNPALEIDYVRVYKPR